MQIENAVAMHGKTQMNVVNASSRSTLSYPSSYRFISRPSRLDKEGYNSRFGLVYSLHTNDTIEQFKVEDVLFTTCIFPSFPFSP